LRPTVDGVLTGVGAQRRWKALRDYISRRWNPVAANTPIRLLQFLGRCAGYRSSTIRRANLATLCDALNLKALTNDVRPPEVSILLLATGRPERVLVSLVSILLSESTRPREILLGLDDAAAKALAGALGSMVRRVDIKASADPDRALATLARHARGEYLAVLSAGCVALPGWLDAIADTFQSCDDVGLVAAKCVRENGQLRQAGAYTAADGALLDLGDGDNPAHPRYNYTREVDAAASFCFALPKAVWTKLAGPAPNSRSSRLIAAEIAAGIRSMPLRTIYQPDAAVVVPIEPEAKGVSQAGSRPVPRQQRIDDGAAARTDIAEASHPARRKPAILFIDHYVPQWDRDAGSRTTYQYIRMFLDSGFHVTFWPAGIGEDKEYVQPLQRLGVEVFYDRRMTGGFAPWWRKVARHYQYAFTCRPDVTRDFIDELKASRHVRIAYYGVDLHFQRLQRQADVEGSRRLKAAARRIRAVELDICRRSDLIMYPSQEELDILRGDMGVRTAAAAIPIILFTPQQIAASQANLARIEASDPYAMMFVGGFSHTPNVDGLVWFASRVMPILRAHDARFRLTIAGSNPTQDIMDLAASDIEIIGRVSDGRLATLYADSGMSIAPLRYGSGVKGKVIEALGNGTPVVTTTIGAQGIPDASTMAGIADEAAEFAAAIIATATDRALARRRAEAALDFIAARYTVDGLKRQLRPFFSELI
jgi:glycosyltransferase involved in cell wall biosynthesis